MESKLQVFKNEELGQVRVVVINNEPMFVGKDLVESLGYKKKYYDVIKRYCDDEDYLICDEKTQPLGGAEFNYKELGQRGGYLVNEKGALSLITKSRTKSAKFKEDMISFLNLENKVVMRSRLEIEFDSVLSEMCSVFGFEYETQVDIDGIYKLDFYFKEYNLVVEYDEEQHFTPKHKYKDKARENYLKDKLNCEILRLDYRDTNIFNASTVIKKLMLKNI